MVRSIKGKRIMTVSPADIRELKAIYDRYGFTHEETYVTENVIVFTLKTGYFDNADIVKLSKESNTEKAFTDYSKIGFACTVRSFESTKEAELQLFRGFFSVESIVSRLKQDYKRFSEGIVKPFSKDATYTYINAPYQINGQAGESTPYDEIIERLEEKKPILFLVEAAAGFGKTCNAYELVINIINRTNSLPLFAELSRNREARIFKHILLDEIDRTFPLLGSRLVQSEITRGRVITVLDGFDELLRKNDVESDFENREPMLETIGEFLTDSAKIILTTRRTVLFEGDAFHEWIEKNSDKFKLVTIKLSEPRVNDWLIQDRIDSLKNSGLRIEDISNPVLLSYLRCIPQSEFDQVIEDPDLIVDSYFDFMMEREKVRQDLRMDVSKQEDILKSIAEDMYQFGYTSENRDYIVDFILSNKSKILEETLHGYMVSEKPSKEEVANKLASHALLDRSSREPNKIGFINEFVLGHYVGKNILSSEEWLIDDYRFIEPAVLSYQPRSQQVRDELWLAIKTVSEYLSISNRISISTSLKREINFVLKDDEVEGLTIEGVVLGQEHIENFQFNDCIIKNCNFNLENFFNVTFLNCKFYNNILSKEISGSTIYVLGGVGDDDFIKELSQREATELDNVDLQSERAVFVERHVLEKFWPTGRDYVAFKHRPIKLICKETADIKPQELYDALQRLKKKKVLHEPRSSHFVEINFDALAEIREILERD